jgi:hypothetical protein
VDVKLIQELRELMGARLYIRASYVKQHRKKVKRGCSGVRSKNGKMRTEKAKWAWLVFLQSASS